MKQTYKVKRKASPCPLNSNYASFLFADIDISIVTAQPSCNAAGDESNRNQRSLPEANRGSFSYLELSSKIT